MQASTPTVNPLDSANAQFIGLILNWGLFGLLIAQVFTYYMSYIDSDLRIHKIIVHVLSALETLQTILTTYDIHQTFVLNFGDAAFLDIIGLAWFNVPVLSGITGWITELFCAYRIYRISRNKKLSLIVVFLGSSIGEGYRAYHAKTYFVLQSKAQTTRPALSISAILWIPSMVTCDVLIAGAMTYYLVKFKREFQRPSPLIRKLITLTVETGMVTALTAAASIILYVGLPHSQLFNIPGYMIGKVYANSVLRIINSRNRTAHTVDINTFPISFDSCFVSQPSARPGDEENRNSSPSNKEEVV